MFLRRSTQSRRLFPNSNQITHFALGVLSKIRRSFLAIIVTAFVAAYVGLALVVTERAHAATFVVTNTGDNGGVNPAPNDGTGTLRQAIVDANASGGADVITFNSGVTGTILLSAALPDLADGATISGPGANVLTVRRDPNAATSFRIFTVNSGNTVTISGLTISGGLITTSGFGAGINNGGTLMISDCTVSGNSITSQTTSFGGGIYNGGILTIINSTVSGNSVFPSSGGGIYNVGTLTITNSTVSGNSARFSGGGVANFNNGILSISNSTITGNRAASDGNAGGNGGGVSAGATETLNNTIVAGNFRGTGSTADDINGDTINTANYNLIGDASTAGGITNGVNGNKVGVDPLLGPLAYYGGPTATHILKTGSPAIDAGDPNFTSPPNNDQRGVGFARVANSRIDIGAFERQASDINPTLIVTTTADTNANNTCSPANPCSLRDAITAANNSAPDDAIYFAVTGTITLNTNGALPRLDSNMQILGPGANALTVKRDSAAASFRIFKINSGKTVTISGLTITGGIADDGLGGGIFNFGGSLTANNCTIRGNSASVGGGIYNDFATLTVNSCTISGNSADLGGGILNDGKNNPATVTINNSTLSGNSATNLGGGLYNNGNTGGSATLMINNSTISGNSASNLGGGIYNDGSAAGSATLKIAATVLKAGASGANIANASGTVTSLGYNLSSDAAGGDGTTGPGGLLNQTGDQRNTDPKLGPLQDNGGPTFTHALDCSSPAINRGKNFATATTDQRGPGFARTFGAAAVSGGDGTDIGAFEVQIVCNQPPKAMDDSYSTDEDTPLNVTAPGVLSNDSDPDSGDTITAVLVSGPSHASSFTLNSDGSFDYTPDTNYNGGDSFSYQARDSHNADSAAVTVSITVNSVNDPPVFNSVATITRKQNAGTSNSQIATVSDPDNSAGSLSVTVKTPATGITVTNIQNNNGTITADVSAGCDAALGSNTVVLQVSDGDKTATGNLTVNVTASNPPVITLKAASVVQPNVNHSYRTFTISDMVQSATDDCDGNVINNVVIEKATSDEVENSPGPGDGNTLNDIVIANGCKSVQLRAERDGTLNGRVYLITLRVSDSSGNVTRAVYKVSVPVGKPAAVDSGVAYTVTSACPP